MIYCGKISWFVVFGEDQGVETHHVSLLQIPELVAKELIFLSLLLNIWSSIYTYGFIIHMDICGWTHIYIYIIYIHIRSIFLSSHNIYVYGRLLCPCIYLFMHIEMIRYILGQLGASGQIWERCVLSTSRPVSSTWNTRPTMLSRGIPSRFLDLKT